ncbi:tRNA-splicing endonuclease subunit Sen54 isoform X6 [Scyliorhinus canicula]|uniref:tRNA-splicing endonuclease subunit Sen54 isoform X6 n=1 Tax=Scyliorhinus canicula TaxID=7830 RepID=UPI0018F50CA3|nr:tRNA-splicing endonuclease subunit Sen54 isoform X6 [Scyliorhinus canicula]
MFWTLSMAAAEERVLVAESRCGRTLSSEELFAARSRDHKIPQRTHGQKDFIPDHSEEQTERLRVCREEQWQLLSEERVERLGNFGTPWDTWKMGNNCCTPRKHYTSLSVSKKSHSDLPAEAESSCSITEGQQKEEFHQQDATCNALEKEVTKPALEPQQTKAEKLQGSDDQPSGISMRQAELELMYCAQHVSGSSIASSPGSPQGSSVSVRKPRWDFSRIKFPNVGRDCPQTKFTALDPMLLPPNVLGRASDETAWQRKINLKHEKLSRRDRERMKRESRYKSDVNRDKRVRQCTNWKEYKELLRWKRGRNKKLPAHLWKDKVQPLFKPGQACSPGELQQHICIMKSAHILDRTPWLQEAPEKMKISFDVYQADTVAEFRKTQPGRPFSRMCVCSFDGPVPDLRTMKKLAFQSGEVPVVFAVVDNGDISFYTFKEFKLPVDVYP